MLLFKFLISQYSAVIEGGGGDSSQSFVNYAVETAVSFEQCNVYGNFWIKVLVKCIMSVSTYALGKKIAEVVNLFIF